MEKIQKRLDLRKQFLAKEKTAREVEIEGRITEAERNLSLTESRVDIIREQLARFTDLESRGMISPMEVTQLRFALNSAEAELDLAALELNILRETR
jgi:multidrug resistance efflux pump